MSLISQAVSCGIGSARARPGLPRRRPCAGADPRRAQRQDEFDRIPGLHFHDLRHTGNMLAAPGASLADLKARMGHDSARAAMIYQHATAEADQAIAEALDKRITGSQKTDQGRDGAAGMLAKTG
jgi:integrase